MVLLNNLIRQGHVAMNKDFDKFTGFTTENVIKNWGRLVTENIKNDIKGKKSPEEIPMINALENLGIELTPEEKGYFKDKVLTCIDLPDNNFIDITNHKLTVTVNYVKDNSAE